MLNKYWRPGHWSVSGGLLLLWELTPDTASHTHWPRIQVLPPLITGCVGQTHSEAASHCPVHANYCKSPIGNVSAQRGRRMLEKKKIKYRNSGANLRSLPFRQREKKEHNNNNEVLFSFVNCHSRSRRLCDAALVTWQDVTRVARDNSELVTNSWQVYLSGNKNEWDTRPFSWPFKEILHQKYPR